MSFSWTQFRVVFLKELLEAARDPRSLVPLILLSLILGPALTDVYPAVVAGTVRKEVQQGCRVAYPQGRPEIIEFLKRGSGVNLVDLAGEEPRKALLKGKVDAVVDITGDFQLADLSQPRLGRVCPKVDIQYDGKTGRGYFAALRLKALFEGLGLRKLEERKENAQIKLASPDWLQTKVMDESGSNCASPFLQSWLSAILVFMAMMSILYPSLDAITGERERGTLEYLLVTSVERRSLFLGKLATIVFCSYCSVFCALSGFYAAQFFQPKHTYLPLPFTSSLPLSCYLILAAAMLPLCLTLSASAMALASFSRTVQQGQGYLSPLLSLAMLPIGLSFFGNIHLTPSLAVVPYLGTIVAMNDILAGRVDQPWLLVSMAVSVIFSLALTVVVSPVVEREDILFGLDQSPQRRFSEGDFRREIFFLCATIFLLMFYVSQNLVIAHHLLGLALTQILLILIPGLVLVFWLKLPWRITLRLTAPKSLLAILGAALTAPLTVAVAGLIGTLASQAIPGSKAFSKIMAQVMGLDSESVWLLLLVLGVLPGICEELLFRGVILSCLPRNYSDKRRILVVGTLFGAFHMSLVRFAPTALLGYVLTWLALRGSIIPCMVLHACHNMLSVMVALHYKDGSPPLSVLVAALLSGAVGIFLLRSACRK